MEITTAVTATTGGNAKLPCNLTPPSSQDRVSLVIWYKGDSKMPIYSVDVRGRALEVASHWADDKALSGRGRYMADPPMSYLILEGVNEADAGSFKCRVDFRFSPTRNSFVNLTVIVPPRKLTLLDSNGGSLQTSYIGPVMEGSGVQLTCIAVGGRPPPRVSWYRDGVMVDDTDETLSERRVKNVLIIERVERRHLGSLLTCKASNTDTIEPLSTTVTIDLHLRPLEVSILAEKGPLSAGHEYEIPCQTFGSRPTPVVTWWKAGRKIQSNIRESVSSDGNVTISMLIYVPKIEDSGQVISCRVMNSHFPAQVMEDSLTLNIHYAPVVSLELGSSLNATTIKEGMDVYFDCSVQAYPWIRRLSWLHNNEDVENNASLGRIITNQTLVLQAVTRKAAGRYSCKASNSEGETESKPFNLDIKYEPQCKPSQQKVYGAARGEEISITCGVDANPPALWFRWIFNNSAIRTKTIESFEAGGGRSVAAYRPVQESDYGTLLCWGRNTLGSQPVPCVFHVVPAGKPDAPHNCSATNKSQTWLQVRCSKGFDGGLPQVFYMEVTQATTSITTSTSTTTVDSPILVANMTSRGSPTFSIQDLEPGTTYLITVYSGNGKGRSVKATSIRVATLGHTLHQHHRTNESETELIDPVLWIAVAGGILAVLILIVLVLVIRRKRHRSQLTQERTSEHDLAKSRTELLTVIGPTEDDRNPDVIPSANVVGCTVNAQYLQDKWEEQIVVRELQPHLPPDKLHRISTEELAKSFSGSARSLHVWRGELRNAETQTQHNRHKESAV
ncbi:nephrin isoform X2 [Nilaparvata lugens]|uniref:nephrin isoform X2 n=1 Tax=Nilaparvata lugens TaxID=108931 RepID=UPI00193DCD56|nr:nephrin isoform X2 [Nilaparvata lugens]